MILNMIEGKSLPVYGDGKNIRDWIYVEDHNRAVWDIMQKGVIGSTYNIGGDCQVENIKLLHTLIEVVAEKTRMSQDAIKNTITYVKDRPGHDFRYAIDCSKIKRELGWKTKVDLKAGLLETVDWYLKNKEWINSIRSGEYRAWIKNNYEAR
jgi:dTDP-glucose 4,6-dehydratase